MSRPAETSGATTNPFIRSIREGRIHSRDELRGLYRQLAMRTHPDAVGSDRLSRKFIEVGVDYEEALRFLDALGDGATDADPGPAVEPRLEFYEALHVLERVDTPFNFSRRRDATRIRRLTNDARSWFEKWRPDLAGLFAAASAEYARLKRERPAGPYRKDDLYSNVYPFFNNITCFHVMGNSFYGHQMRRNLDAVTARLDQRGMAALKEFLLFLIADSAGGPACGG